MKWRISSLNFYLILWIASCSASSVFAADYHSPRTAGLGGAGHAGPILNDAIYLNPSFTSFMPTYGFAASYLLHSNAAEQGGRAFNISIQDGRTELFQAGVGYTVRDDGLFVHLGASKALIKRFGLGLGGKFHLPNRDERPSVKDSNLSITGLVADWFQIALIADNLIEGPEAREARLFREYVIGTKFNIMGIVILYFDPHWVPHAPEGKTFGAETALEFTLFKDAFLRLGGFRNSAVPFHDGVPGTGFSTGVGWVAPRISIDYAFTRVLDSSLGRADASSHNFGFTVYF